ncbi:MAG: EVE domain-containing protein, partial [Calditrichaeota bacterium]|nr:EVE domain-containing protein [Calditrichota bacterium]
MNYWLMKTEPEAYSWDDLKNKPNSTDFWDGVRNYQARNFMRDMKVGDKVFFYHSQINPPAIVGIATVVREAYPDPTQFDPESKY